jgi:catechol 2,3-dioxygenase-like lactoylglutathione lyase family enzyme
MFKHSKAFASFSVNDLQATRQFYGKTLGLDVSERPEGLDLHLGVGSHAFVYPKPDHVPATFTILNFPVKDVDRAVDDLTKAGVRFEIYRSGPLETDSRGVARCEGKKIAWFKDPSGNYLSVLEEK